VHARGEHALLPGLLGALKHTYASPSSLPYKKLGLLLLLAMNCALGGRELMQKDDPAGAKLNELQAFSSLCLHERKLKEKYGEDSVPAPITEALAILARHKEEFYEKHPFHSVEEDWLRTHPKLGYAFPEYVAVNERRKVKRKRKLPGSSALSSCSETDDESCASTATSARSESGIDQDLSVEASNALALKRRLADERSARFRLLYKHIEPKITEFVVFLLRLLLTSCHRILGSGERQEDRPCGDGEAKRHKSIMAQAVSGILALLLDESRRANPKIFCNVAHWITETNGYLVVLKFLNQDLVCAPDPGRPTPVLPLLKATSNPLPPALEMATFQLLRCLYSLCKNSP
jgi:hypothetical protein